MTAFLDISAALDTQLEAMSGLPPVAWENDSYTPVVGTLYVRVKHLPSNAEAGTIGASGVDEYTGAYLVDVFAPADEGKNEAFAMADLIANQFKRDTELTYNSRIVHIKKAYTSPAQNDSGWYQVPLTIEYYSFTAQRA